MLNGKTKEIEKRNPKGLYMKALPAALTNAGVVTHTLRVMPDLMFFGKGADREMLLLSSVTRWQANWFAQRAGLTPSPSLVQA